MKNQNVAVYPIQLSGPPIGNLISETGQKNDAETGPAAAAILEYDANLSEMQR